MKMYSTALSETEMYSTVMRERERETLSLFGLLGATHAVNMVCSFGKTYPSRLNIQEYSRLNIFTYLGFSYT